MEIAKQLINLCSSMPWPNGPVNFIYLMRGLECSAGGRDSGYINSINYLNPGCSAGSRDSGCYVKDGALEGGSSAGSGVKLHQGLVLNWLLTLAQQVAGGSQRELIVIL